MAPPKVSTGSPMAMSVKPISVSSSCQPARGSPPAI